MLCDVSIYAPCTVACRSAVTFTLGGVGSLRRSAVGAVAHAGVMTGSARPPRRQLTADKAPRGGHVFYSVQIVVNLYLYIISCGISTLGI